MIYKHLKTWINTATDGIKKCILVIQKGKTLLFYDKPFYDIYLCWTPINQ